MNPAKNYISKIDNPEKREVHLTKAQIRKIESSAKKLGVSFEDMVMFVVHISLRDPDEFGRIL